MRIVSGGLQAGQVLQIYWRDELELGESGVGESGDERSDEFIDNVFSILLVVSLRVRRQRILYFNRHFVPRSNSSESGVGESGLS